MDDYSSGKAGSFSDIFDVVEPVTNYCSLVDKRCRDFIHWRRAAKT
jgi:hypothetical protein